MTETNSRFGSVCSVPSVVTFAAASRRLDRLTAGAFYRL